MIHHLGHHEVASPVDFHGGRGVFRSPLEVNNVERGSLVERPVHAPEPGISPQHLQAGAQAEDHVRLLSCLAGSSPVNGPLDRASLTEVNDCVLQAVTMLC